MPLTPGRYFEENMALFAALLRSEGLLLGTAELLDALQSLRHIDIADRASFKTALRATLVKNERDLEIFDRSFERFFVPQAAQEQQFRETTRLREERESRLAEAAEELSFKGEPLPLSTEEMLLYTSLNDDQRRNLQRFVQETEAAERESQPLRPLLETVVKGHLRYWHSRKEQLPAEEENGGGEGGGEGGVTRRSADKNRHLREFDIRMLRESDLPAARALLDRLSRQLLRRLVYQRQRSATRGALDFRRTMRANMRFGGRPFLLKHRRRRRSQLQLLLLGDLSASMKRYSSFVLQFFYGLQAVVTNLEIFSFADTLEYLTPALREQGGLDQVLERVVLQGQSWGGGTNIGAALTELREGYSEMLTHRTVVIVVSDTRTVQLNRALPALQKLRERVRRVLWLNPLPPEQWPLYRSVQAFGEIAEMWPCNTIAQLEEAVAGRLFAATTYLDQEVGKDDQAYRHRR
jgi:uncharacterized protein with von Willebrand factor type A (vWA) domain